MNRCALLWAIVGLLFAGGWQSLQAKADKVHIVGSGLKLTGEFGEAPAITYQVKLSADRTYVMTMTSPNSLALDPYLRLRDAAGKQLAVDDGRGGVGSARIIFHAQASGTYRVVAMRYGKGRGPFRLTIREAQDEVAAQAKLWPPGHWRVVDFRLELADAERLARMDGQQRALLDQATKWNHQAISLSQAGKPGDAIKLAEQASAIRKQLLGNKHPQFAESLNNLGSLYRAQADYAKAETHCLTALDIRKEVLGEKHPDFATSVNNLALLYDVQGNHAKAEPLYLQALDVRKEALGEKSAPFADSLNNLAGLYDALEEYKKAEPLYRKALAIRKEMGGEKTTDLATSLNNLAMCYRAQGLYVKAEPLYLQALEINRERLGEKHPDFATSLNNLAALYHAQGSYDKAEPFYVQALEIRKTAWGEKHPRLALNLNNLAALYEAQGSYDKAQPFYEKALAASQISLDKLEPNQLNLSPTTLAILENHAWSMLSALPKQPSASALRSCDHTFVLAFHCLDRLRLEYRHEQASKISLTDERFRLFPGRIDTLRRLWLLEQKSADLEAAFSTAEQGTARSFLESLGSGRANILAGVSRELRSAEEKALQPIRLLDLRIKQESEKPLPVRDADLVGRLIRQRHQAEDSLRQVISRIEKEYPLYAGFKYPRPCTVQQARACLAVDEVGLLFVPGTRKSYLVLVEASPKVDDKANGLAIIELPPSATLADEVEALTDEENLPLHPRVRSQGRDAFDMILGPCKERIAGKNLVIVPGGPLGLLPFELLVEPDGKFLIEKHRIRYAPSLTALHFIRLWKEQRTAPTTPLFAVGDPLYDGESFRRLEHSGREVAEIAKLLTANEEQVLTGKAAAEANVKAASSAGTLCKARYVHFATHGTVSIDRTKQPALVLNQVGNKGEDGLLHLDEITNLKLNADLVVLSACQTGKGRLARGEGVTGLARAFLYAGSKGVVCSLWSVDDRETADLMVDFYGHLQKGRSASEALREAQLRMIRDGKAPLYWAPFIVIGE